MKCDITTTEVAFFPGKFHPPHLGHIKTVQKILSKYKKLIVCVSGHIPNEPVTTPVKIYLLLKSFFEDLDNVEVIFLNETLIEKNNLNNLPLFDVLLSGNQEVLDWAKKQNIKVEFIPRSDGFLCTGSEIRTIINKEKRKNDL